MAFTLFGISVQVSRLLGHDSPAFTLSVYAHLMDDGTGEPLELDFASGALAAAVAHVGRQGDVRTLPQT